MRRWMGLALVGAVFLLISLPLLINWLFNWPAWGGWALVGGLLVVAGDHTTWPQGEAELLPGKLGATIDRTFSSR